MIDVHLADGFGTKQKAKVTSIGQVVVAPISYDDTVFKELDATGTAFNFYEPKTGQQFVVTGIRIKAARSVSNTVDAVIIIYEASTIAETTVDKVIHEEALIRGESSTLLPTNILVNEGKYVNAKTTDVSIFITIMGYYIDSIT